jgi:uncharacterized damage-inducible protein DinB
LPLVAAGALEWLAMPPLQPEDALVIRSFVLPNLTAEHPVTRRVIEAIPLDKCDYRPDAICKSAIDLAWHIVGAEHRFLDAVATGAFDFTNTGRPDSVRTSLDVARWYGETFERDVERLRTLTADQLVRTIDFRGILQLPAVAYAEIGLKHSIHHRGQLSMYLRPMGAKVPPIYGESYDSAQAKAPRA